MFLTVFLVASYASQMQCEVGWNMLPGIVGKAIRRHCRFGTPVSFLVTLRDLTFCQIIPTYQRVFH